MLANYHTHTSFCDGANTPEDVVLYAIDKGFSSLGFSGHGYTDFDSTYCMQDTDGYIAEITRLKRKYKEKLQIYCGVEEDAFSAVKREKFDYIIGSSHYFNLAGTYYSIDHSHDCFKKCMELFNYDVVNLAQTYYSTFVNYISIRKPDIVGHFDLITKFDEIDNNLFFNNQEYIKIAEEYIKIASENDVIFEVNTGAISRGYRKKPYPAENLLYILKEKESKLTLSSDSHSIETIDFHFEETKKLLKSIGFSVIYELYDGKFIKRYI